MIGTRWTRVAAGLVALGVAVTASAGCGGRKDNAKADTGAAISCKVTKDTRITVATGNATGVYYALGNAFAPLLSSATDGKLKATAAETGASGQNIQGLASNEYGVAFALADVAADAYNGTGSFEGKKADIQALARLYDNYTQVVVRTSAGINSVADMKGKRVSTGSPKSGTEVVANRLLKAAGLDPEKDIKAQRLDLTKTVDGMKNGSIDALFWSGGLPTPGITDLFTTVKDKVKFIDITPLLPEMQKINPVYTEGSIPAATYGMAQDAKTIVVPNLLLARADVDPNVACAVTRALFDKKDELIRANAAAKGVTLDNARKTDPIPLNQGSAKALDDLGASK